MSLYNYLPQLLLKRTFSIAKHNILLMRFFQSEEMTFSLTVKAAKKNDCVQYHSEIWVPNLEKHSFFFNETSHRKK